jgi:hypothetical protein
MAMRSHCAVKIDCAILNPGRVPQMEFQVKIVPQKGFFSK